MAIEIIEINQDNYQLMDRVNGEFMVDSRLRLAAEDGVISYTIVPVDPYLKRYAHDDTDYTAYINHPKRTAFFAFLAGELAGQIVLRKNWNLLAYVEDIAVDARFRKQGVGQALMRRAVRWARDGQMPGICLETQDINVAACRFYERFGFQLGGFDRFLYHATLPGSGEIALYWYLLFLQGWPG